MPWHTLAAHLIQFNVACCLIIGSDALCWSISSYLCSWLTGFYSAGLWCRLTGWRYNRIYITGERSPQRSDWQSSQFIYLKLCVVWLSVSPLLHSVATTEAALGICVVGGEKKAAGTGIFTTLPSEVVPPAAVLLQGHFFFLTCYASYCARTWPTRWGDWPLHPPSASYRTSLRAGTKTTM